jgi:hypothetical protein
VREETAMSVLDGYLVDSRLSPAERHRNRSA